MPEIREREERSVDRGLFKAFQTNVNDRFDLLFQEQRKLVQELRRLTADYQRLLERFDAGEKVDEDRHRESRKLGWVWFVVGTVIGIAGLAYAFADSAGDAESAASERVAMVERAEEVWLDRPLTARQQEIWTGEVAKDEKALVFMFAHPESLPAEQVARGEAEDVARGLYRVFGDRGGPGESAIDAGGLVYWTSELERGVPLPTVAFAFLEELS